jgi:hypothetical protein
MLTVLVAGATAQVEVADVVGVAEEFQEEAVAAQGRVEALDDEVVALLAEYNGELERIEDLETYNDNMRGLLDSQAEEKAELHRGLDELEVVRQTLVPLMVEMVDVLDRFVHIDQPMLRDERLARVERVRDNLTRSDVEISEKYRRIVEAYQIEAEYGQSIEAYEGPISLDGRDLTVDFLRVGRVGLFYLTLDRAGAGVWDRADGRWVPLDGRYVDAVDYAVRLARKQAPPDLVDLPLFTETPR